MDEVGGSKDNTGVLEDGGGESQDGKGISGALNAMQGQNLLPPNDWIAGQQQPEGRNGELPPGTAKAGRSKFRFSLRKPMATGWCGTCVGSKE